MFNSKQRVEADLLKNQVLLDFQKSVEPHIKTLFGGTEEETEDWFYKVYEILLKGGLPVAVLSKYFFEHFHVSNSMQEFLFMIETLMGVGFVCFVTFLEKLEEKEVEDSLKEVKSYEERTKALEEEICALEQIRGLYDWYESYFQTLGIEESVRLEDKSLVKRL